MKRIITGILALVALLALGGCGEKAPEQMARDEYLVYSHGTQYDIFSKLRDDPDRSEETYLSWYDGVSSREAVGLPWEDWETKRGLRNGKDGLGEVLFLYGDEKADFLSDDECDIQDLDITLNEWREANPSHRDHISYVTYKSNLGNPYDRESNSEAQYRMYIYIYRDGEMRINFSEHLFASRDKE